MTLRAPQTLSLLLLLSACRAGSTTADSSAPTNAPVASASAPEQRASAEEPAPAQSFGPAPITSIAELRHAVDEQLAGRVDEARGVIFIDIYDDEREETKPIEAVRVCGDALRPLLPRWAANLRGRLQDPLYEDERHLHCEEESCWHEASEAGDHRGLYRFDRGRLEAVAWTSGPPAHIATRWLDAEDVFVEAALAALRDAPCGETYTGAIQPEPGEP